jgi:hypothetical protein
MRAIQLKLIFCRGRAIKDIIAIKRQEEVVGPSSILASMHENLMLQ